MSDKRLKVLFLPKWYPNRFDTLDGIFVVDHARAAALYHDVFILFVHSDPELQKRISIRTIHLENIVEVTAYFRHRKTEIRFLDQLITAVKYLLAQFKAYRYIRKKYGMPDLVHVHVLLRSSLLALWLKARKNIPYVITEHWSGYDPETAYTISRFKRKMLAFVIKKASAVTTVSAYLREHVQRINGTPPCFVISNAVNETLFKPAENRVSSEKKKLVHVSTLDDYPKNMGGILRAIAKVAEKNNNFELHIIGKGVEMEKQQALARQLNLLETTVFFHGYLPKNEVANQIAQSDCMLLFSHYETQSCVLLESFMCGTPVIAGAAGGVAEIVEPHNGIPVPHLDEDQFCTAILSFLNGEIIFDRAQIRKQALKYSYPAIGEAFSEVYQHSLTT